MGAIKLVSGSVFSVLLAVILLANIAAAQTVKEQFARSAEGLSLTEAAETALRGHPGLRAAAAGRELAAAQMMEARAARLPQLQLTETITRSNNPVFVFGSLLEQGRFGAANFALNSLNNPDSLTNFRAAVNFRMPIFDQRYAATRISQAAIAGRQADAETEWARQQVLFGVIGAYYGVIVAETRRDVAAEAVRSAEADLKRMQALYDNGLIVLSDLLAMKVQLADFAQQRIAAQGEVVTAYAALDVAMGAPIGPAPHLTGELNERIFPVIDQQELIKQALTRRPDYQQRRMMMESRDQDVRAAAAQYLPRVDAFASFGASSNSLFNGSSDYTMGVTVTFNLFDRTRAARLRAARAARQASDAERQRQADQIGLDVVRAYQHYLAAQARLDVAANSIKAAQETLRIVQDRHENGLANITEVLRAQTALVSARLNLASARYDYYLGYAETQLASGQLESVSDFTR